MPIRNIQRLTTLTGHHCSTTWINVGIKLQAVHALNNNRNHIERDTNRGSVNGKIAIVTGATRGQGEAEARILIAEGAKIMLTDILDTDSEKPAQEFGDNTCLNVLETTEAKFGPITVLINNADILKIGALADTPQESGGEFVIDGGITAGFTVGSRSIKKPE